MTKYIKNLLTSMILLNQNNFVLSIYVMDDLKFNTNKNRFIVAHDPINSRWGRGGTKKKKVRFSSVVKKYVIYDNNIHSGPTNIPIDGLKNSIRLIESKLRRSL